ncbi:MAG: hypothetical protein ABI747_04565 [Candidatus Moraniibacteriota bacterium]
MKQSMNTDENRDSRQKPGTKEAKKKIGSMYQAHRLEGKVENRGIKNIGKQAKKPAHRK